jgi:hypothetical protein
MEDANHKQAWKEVKDNDRRTRKKYTSKRPSITKP